MYEFYDRISKLMLWALIFELQKYLIGFQNVFYKGEASVVDENKKLTQVGLGIK